MVSVQRRPDSLHFEETIALPKVMIVDNERATASLLQTLLELDGFEVAIVGRGSLVVERAQQNPPDVFLLDYRLDDIEGTEVTRRLRATSEFAHTPIVMSSGLNIADEAYAAGASLFLIKPFEPSELAGILSGLIKSP